MISVIQVFLFMQFCLAVFCELTPMFANTWKSIVLRTLVGFCLIVLMYYSIYLPKAPHIVIVVLFLIIGAFTFLSYKFVLSEYFTRLKRSQRKEYLEQLKISKKILIKKDICDE